MEPSSTSAPIQGPSTNPYIPDISKIMSVCREDDTFCTVAENYPADYIKSLLQKSSDTFGDLFGRDEIASNVSISTRIDLTIDGTPMCASKEQVIEPPVGRNKDNEWKYIVNAGPYVQGIRVEMCEWVFIYFCININIYRRRVANGIMWRFGYSFTIQQNLPHKKMQKNTYLKQRWILYDDEEINNNNNNLLVGQKLSEKEKKTLWFSAKELTRFYKYIVINTKTANKQTNKKKSK